MTIRDDITIDWASSPRIIEIAAPSDKIAVQDLYDTLRDIGSMSENIGEDEIVDASGKETLGESLLVGITVKLLNARLKFEDRNPPTIVCDISGGNLVAVDSDNQSINPIEPSAFVTVTKTASVSAALIGSAVLDDMGEEVSILKEGISFLAGMIGGRWKIAGNQMIFYKPDNTTEIARFNLLNRYGQPAIKEVMERVRV